MTKMKGRESGSENQRERNVKWKEFLINIWLQENRSEISNLIFNF